MIVHYRQSMTVMKSMRINGTNLCIRFLNRESPEQDKDKFGQVVKIQTGQLKQMDYSA